MSHAEAFGHFRSFVVGLEKNARALRKVLEENGDDCGWRGQKRVNGSSGISSMCAEVLEVASPEVTAKELIAEVAHQETSLRKVEATIQSQTSIDVVMEKYRAMTEYNQLAFVDLEERLAAYGYVPPARSGDDCAATGAGSPAGRAAPFHTQDDDVGDGGGGGGGGGSDHHEKEFLDDVVRDEEDTTCEEESVVAGGSSVVPAAQEVVQGDVTREAAHCADVGAVAVGEGGHEEETVTPRRTTNTPPRRGFVLGEDDSPVTPAIADWEISKETRQMLRQGRAESIASPSTVRISAARSLEALLAGNSTLTVANNVSAQMDTNSDDLRPTGATSKDSLPSPLQPPCCPPSNTETGGPGARSHVPSASEITVAGGDARRQGENQRRRRRQTEYSCGSDAPTPPLPSLEGSSNVGGSWTPRRCLSSNEGRDRDSVETPKPLFRSPMKTPMHRSFFEACMSVGHSGGMNGTNSSLDSSSVRTSMLRSSFERIEGDDMLALNDESVCVPLEESTVTTPAQGVVTTAAEPQAGSVPWMEDGGAGEDFQGQRGEVDDELSEARYDEFRRNGSPASFVRSHVSSKPHKGSDPTLPGVGRTGGERADSSETPRTPEKLGPPLYLYEDSCAPSGIRGNNAPSAPTTPTALGAPAMPLQTSNEASPGPASSSRYGDHGDNSYHDDYGDGFDAIMKHVDSTFEEIDDDVATPELPSPPRTASILMSAKALDKNGRATSGGGRRRLAEAEVDAEGEHHENTEAVSRILGRSTISEGPLELVSEEEYARAPSFLTIQVSRNILNEAIRNLNAYAAPRVKSPSELLLTAEEISAIIDQGDLSRTLLLSAAHLKRVEMKENRMYRIRCDAA